MNIDYFDNISAVELKEACKTMKASGRYKINLGTTYSVLESILEEVLQNRINKLKELEEGVEK
jgi:hypothetical protein